MKATNHVVSCAVIGFFCIMLGGGSTACASESWKEEVLLHDGRTIVVARSVERGGPHEAGQQPPYKEQSLSFTMPDTNRNVTWEDHYDKNLGSANFLPMALEVYKGTAYLVVSTMGCLSYNKWGRPNPSYVIFKYQGNEWRRITLEELPAEIKTPNLIVSDPDNVVEKLQKSFVPATTIQKIISEYPQRPYKIILREPIPNGGQGRCGELIYTKDGWKGVGFFTLQRSYEACVKYCDIENVATRKCPCASLFKIAKH